MVKGKGRGSATGTDMWNRISGNPEARLHEPRCRSLPLVTIFLLRFLLQKKKINLGVFSVSFFSSCT